MYVDYFFTHIHSIHYNDLRLHIPNHALLRNIYIYIYLIIANIWKKCNEEDIYIYGRMHIEVLVKSAMNKYKIRYVPVIVVLVFACTHPQALPESTQKHTLAYRHIHIVAQKRKWRKIFRGYVGQIQNIWYVHTIEFVRNSKLFFFFEYNIMLLLSTINIFDWMDIFHNLFLFFGK